MACRRYYDGLCTGGPCEVCVEGESTGQQMDFDTALTMILAILVLAFMMFAVCMAAWLVF